MFLMFAATALMMQTAPAPGRGVNVITRIQYTGYTAGTRAPGEPWVVVARQGDECVTIVARQRISDAALERRARKWPRTITVGVNQDVPYGCIAQVTTVLRAAGVVRVGLVPVLPRPALSLSKECIPAVDGKAISFEALGPILKRWGEEDQELNFQPDPEAGYECVDRVLGLVRQSRITKLGFVGNEMADPESKQ